MATQEWQGIVNVTTKKYLKGSDDMTLRGRLMLSELKKRGRLMKGESGTSITWALEFANPPVSSYGDGETIDFVARDKWRTLDVDWRSLYSTDAMSVKQVKMNTGTEAIVKRWGKLIPDLRKTMDNKVEAELYTDGYASGNNNRFCGIESFCGVVTPVAADIICAPSDTYGGKSTILGTYGGTWSADGTAPNAALANDWPNGTGSAEYDFLAPKFPKWDSTGWIGSGQTAWEDTCERVLRQTTEWCHVVNGTEGELDVYLLNSALSVGYFNKQSAKQRIMVPWKTAEDLGFKGRSATQEGVGIMSGYGVPANTFYGINFDQMELRILGNDMYDVEGPNYEDRSRSYLLSIFTDGNFTFNPKGFAKGKNFAV